MTHASRVTVKKDRGAVLSSSIDVGTKRTPQGNEIVKFADSGPTLITCE